MTSRSRRKHRTTVPNTTAARRAASRTSRPPIRQSIAGLGRSGRLATLVALVCTAATAQQPSVTIRLINPAEKQAAVELQQPATSGQPPAAATRSALSVARPLVPTGDEQTTVLRWRGSENSASQHSLSQSPRASFVIPASAQQPLGQPSSPQRIPTAAALGDIDPFNDPFGDKRAAPTPSAPQLTRPSVQPPALFRVAQQEDQEQLPDPSAQPMQDPQQREPVDYCAETLRRLKEDDISKISLDIRPNMEPPEECDFGEPVYQQRVSTPMTFAWKASAACHKPLYFEEVQLERYGHTASPWVQPVISGAHFFANVATLPYQAGIHPPHECQYALGYYRPGSCAPWLVPPVPLSVRGGLAQAGAIVGGIALFP